LHLSSSSSSVFPGHIQWLLAAAAAVLLKQPLAAVMGVSRLQQQRQRSNTL
jgi:hypothetical protein